MPSLVRARLPDYRGGAIRHLRVSLAALLSCALVACAPGVHRTVDQPTRPPAVVSQPTAPPETVVLPGGGAARLSAQAALTFFDAAPLAVVADPLSAVRGASLAVDLGVPVLVAGDDPSADVLEALDDLGTETVLAVGEPGLPDGLDVVPAPQDVDELAALVRSDLETSPVAPGDEVRAVAGLEPGTLLVEDATGDAGTGDATEDATGDASNSGGSTDDPRSADSSDDAGGPADDARLPYSERPEAVARDVVVMSTGAAAQAAAAASARAAGAQVQVVPDGDPRASSETVQATAEHAPDVVAGLGSSFGDAETLAWRTATAATGTELPGGGQLILPGRTYVAIYGSPGTGALGVLGEQDTAETVRRAAEHAEPFRRLTDTQVVPTLEIIATVATRGAGPDGDYSNELPLERLRPLVDAAAENGQWVVLDLQPGRADFLSQAKRYEELLREPHVGLALDPEWRLGPDEEPMQRIGHVDVGEVDQVVTWLADLTREERLPQKMLVLHQFRTDMIPGVDRLDTSRDEVAVLLHADGQGTQGDKLDTWRSVRANAPSLQWWGWKNFYDEDSPMLGPTETMAVEPTPNYVSYQ
ncbi:hypothetical protein [Georgenia alba]|uniref:Lipoprotein n=1 Tax=Georgenia alba TaxID=2233858 RepID=A0ABW2QDC1_9MICO